MVAKKKTKRKKLNKEDEKIRDLQKIIRQLKDDNKTLRKQLSQEQANKQEINDYAEHLIIFDSLTDELCPECSKAILNEVNVGTRTFKRCELCGYRTKTNRSKT